MAKKDKTPSSNSAAGNDEASQMETSATAILATGTVTQSFGPNDKDRIAVDLPRRCAAGMVMDEKQASIIDNHNARQFANNMNAGAKYRAEKLPSAETDADKAKYAPWTAADYLSAWNDYKGADVGRLRTSSVEKMRQEAAWNAWKEILTEHNAQFPSGFHPLLGDSAKGKKVLPNKKEKEAVVAKLLKAPRFAEIIGRHFAILEAAADVEKPKADDAPTANGADLI